MALGLFLFYGKLTASLVAQAYLLGRAASIDVFDLGGPVTLAAVRE